MQVTAARVTDPTTLILSVTSILSTDVTIQLSELSLSCGSIVSADTTLSNDELVLEISQGGGCSSNDPVFLSVGALALTNPTQNVYPTSVLVTYV